MGRGGRADSADDRVAGDIKAWNGLDVGDRVEIIVKSSLFVNSQEILARRGIELTLYFLSVQTTSPRAHYSLMHRYRTRYDL